MLNTFFASWMVLLLNLLGVHCNDLPQLNPLSIPHHLSIESSARLLCVASSGDQPIDFEWLKDGKALNFGRIEQLNQWTSSLTIYPLSLDHIGNYSCRASNTLGKSLVTSSLFVTAPPHWIVQPNDTRVRAGDKAVFQCEARGSPEVKISWKRVSESESILPLPRDAQTHENGSLVIVSSQKSESGLYLCEADNGIGKALQKSATLFVYESPIVERITDHVIVQKGQVAHLSCLVKGDKPLYFTWLKNKRFVDDIPELAERSNYSDLPSEGNILFTLSISESKLEDEGLYTCIGKNDFGSDQKEIRLMLVEKPQSPPFVEVVDLWSRSARIKWTAPKNGNSPILSYTIEYWSTKDDRNRKMESVTSTSCILRNLKPFSAYSFYVWASNSIGDSEPSIQSHFVTAKEEPSSPPLDFRVDKVGSNFVRLTWRPPLQEDWNGDLKGYYVGYRRSTSRAPFTFNTVEAEDSDVFYVLRGLQRNTEYLVIVRSFNDVGSGPSAEELSVRTFNQEPLPQPILIINDIGSTYLQLHWIVPEDLRQVSSGFRIHYRKNKEKWQEIAIPDSFQDLYTLTNLDANEPYQVYVTSIGSFGVSEPSEIATVRTSAEAIFQSVPSKPPALHSDDDVTQILYIVVPVAVATVIIVIVIVTACVYVYSKRPLPVSHPYGDLPASKNFSYMSTVPRQRDIPISVCGGNAQKFGSPYSTVPLTRPEPEDDEPIYESVLDCKIKRYSYEDDIKIGDATIV